MHAPEMHPKAIATFFMSMVRTIGEDLKGNTPRNT
jgi:hypothetical protein